MYLFALSFSYLEDGKALERACASKGNYNESQTYMENKRNDCFAIVGHVINCTLETCLDL